MTYTTTPLRLALVLALWMLVVTAACAVVFLGSAEAPADRPIRTRPPLEEGR